MADGAMADGAHPPADPYAVFHEGDKQLKKLRATMGEAPVRDFKYDPRQLEQGLCFKTDRDVQVDRVTAKLSRFAAGPHWQAMRRGLCHSHWHCGSIQGGHAAVYHDPAHRHDRHLGC